MGIAMASLRPSDQVYEELLDELKGFNDGSICIDDLVAKYADDPEGLEKVINASDLMQASKTDVDPHAEFAPAGYEDRPPQFAALEIQSLRNEYAKKFYAQAIIAYLATANEQMTHSADDKKTVASFLQNVWGYDPAKHLRSSYDVIRETEPKRIAAASRVFDKEITRIRAPALEQVQNLNRFITKNYSQLQHWVTVLWDEDPILQDAVIIYDVFPTADAARVFAEKYQEHFNSNLITIPLRQRVAYAPFAQFNYEKLRVASEDPVVAGIFANDRESKTLAADILQNRASKLNKPNAEDIQRLAKLHTDIKQYTDVEVNNEERTKKLEAYQKVREEVELSMAPDGSVMVPIINPMTGERRVIYTQAEQPGETEKRLGDKFAGKPLEPSSDELSDLMEIAQKGI
jgi:hypothetical protein